MNPKIGLAGLQRLKAVCQYHGLPFKMLPPAETVPKPGETVLGQPFDTVLSSLYRETRAAMLGDFQTYPWQAGRHGVLAINEGVRMFAEEPYISSLLFGQVPLLAYYLATVPVLADVKGSQPVSAAAFIAQSAPSKFVEGWVNYDLRREG